ncbi:MAG: polyprenyl synthetase family protein [Armatimonadetes bacterium]|nr:polyprenyl synthetase family protein [Armatimonadota bacterium]
MSPAGGCVSRRHLPGDEVRKPTSHKVFGEAIAILAGDALLALAFQTITSRIQGAPADVVLEVTRRIASAVGTGGMVVGQVVDIISEGREITPETLRPRPLHRRAGSITNRQDAKHAKRDNLSGSQESRKGRAVC